MRLRPKLFADLLKGDVDGCLGRAAQFVDGEKNNRDEVTSSPTPYRNVTRRQLHTQQIRRSAMRSRCGCETTLSLMLPSAARGPSAL